MDLRKGVLKLSDNVQKKHKLISYANGRSLEEINGSVAVPKISASGKRCLCIPVRVSW